MAEILGHPQIQNFKSSIKNNKWGPVHLFVGPSGIGKKSIALGLAEELGCAQHNLLLIKPDGVQIKVQQAREILDFLSLQIVGSGKQLSRVIIIDDAHALNPQAANSLLKTLEEPPPNTYFFLITHSEKSILQTIRSRAQIVRFSPLSKETLKAITQTNQTPTKDWMLLSAQGRLDLIEQLQNPELETQRQFALQILQNTFEKNHKEVFSQLKEQMPDKESALFVSACLQQLLRDILFLKHQLEPLIHSDLQSQLTTLTTLSDETLHDLYKQAFVTEGYIYQNVDRSLVFENWVLESQDSHVD